MAAAQPEAHSAQWAPPRFGDADRPRKLAAAFPEIDRIFGRFVKEQNIPGAAWGVILDGRLAHVGVTGYRDLAAKAPVDSNTVFRIASMTKSFTAMAIMRLRDEGRLSLDDPVERYVPELKSLRYPTTDSPKITIRHLLSHAEGFPEDNPWGDQQLAMTEEEMSALMRRGIPFSNPPGMAYEYSNYGFAILGRVIANVSGLRYDEYVDRYILRPLGMRSTTLQPFAVAPHRLAQGYRREDARWKREPQLPHGAFGSMGGMLTSLSDLGTFVGAFLDAWPPRDGAETLPVRRSSLREMQLPARIIATAASRDSSGAIRLTSSAYGFGLRITSNCTFDHIVSHGGGLPGFGTLMRWLPEYGVGIIAFANRTYAGWNAPFNDAFAAMSRTGGLQPRQTEPSLALINARQSVSRLIQSWNEALADSIAANNLYLDRSRERRRAEFERFRATLGQCRPAEQFDVVENALRGEWTMPCARGALRVSITLAPTIPPGVQYLEARAVPTGSVAERPRACS